MTVLSEHECEVITSKHNILKDALIEMYKKASINGKHAIRLCARGL